MTNMTQYLIALFILLHLASTHAQEKVSLESFLQQIEARNLDLKIKHSEMNAADANSIGVGIPAPMLGIIQMQELGSYAMGFEINQSLPFPTKLFSEKSARNNEARMYKELYSVQKNEVLSTAKLSYIEYWLATQKVQILNERKSILEGHIRLARSAARSDSSMKIHLLKTESDLDLLDNDIDEMKQRLNEKKLKISALLNQPANSPLFEPEEPKTSLLPSKLNVNSHQVQAAYYEWQSFDSKALVADQAWLPDFNLRYRDLGATVMSARQTEIMVGVTLPFLLPWEPYSSVKKAGADRQAAEFRMEKIKTQINSDKEALFSRAQVLKTQLDKVNGKLIPRAHERMKVVHNIAPRDIESLQDHRETMEIFTELKMKALELREEFEKVASELEKFNIQDGAGHE